MAAAVAGVAAEQDWVLVVLLLRLAVGLLLDAAALSVASLPLKAAPAPAVKAAVKAAAIHPAPARTATSAFTLRSACSPCACARTNVGPAADPTFRARG